MKKAIVSKYQRGMETLVLRFKEKHDSQNALHKSLQSTLNDLCSNMAALETVRLNPDSRLPKDAHTLNVSRLASKLQGTTKGMREYISKQAGETERGMAAEMASRSGLKPGAYAPEVRSRFHSMTPGDRIKTIQGLIESKDGASLDALLNSPPVLTGILPQDITNYREQYFTAVCPELVKARDVYRDLKSHIDAAIATVETATIEYTDPQKLRDLELREASSVAAQAQLEGVSHGD